MSAPTSFEAIDARNLVAGTHVSGGTVNLNFNECRCPDPSSSIHPQAYHAIHFPPNDSFVQRSAISEQLDRLLPLKVEYQSAALWGLGGSGKTQIALYYAYSRCSDPACSVFWVHADSETSFAQDYKLIAKKLGLDDALNGKELLETVRNQIETLPQWVLILDNADDLTLFGVGRAPPATESGSSLSGPGLSNYIPRGAIGTVLWTSRDKQIAGSLVGARRGIHVSRMTNTEGEKLLQTIRDLESGDNGTEVEDISQLLDDLDWFPLAISQAATYIRRTRLSIAQYLGKIQERKTRWKMLHKSEHDRYRRSQASNSVLETWNISIDYIREENEMACSILNVLAFVECQNISFEMIVEVVRASLEGGSTSSDTGGGSDDILSGEDTDSSVTDNSSNGDSESEDDALDDIALEAVVRLEEFSFLVARIPEGSSQSRVYDMHKLVQESISYNLHFRKGGNFEEASSAKLAFQVTNSLFPKDYTPEMWNICEQYLIHGQRAGEWAGLHGGETSVAKLLSRISDYLYARRRWRDREIVDLAAVALRTRVLGHLHPSTIRSRGRLAVTYEEQGRSKEAEDIKVEILQQRREILGEKHPDTIWAMITLAITFYHRARYDESEKIFLEALQLRSEISGKRHPQTIAIMAHLAVTYYAQGRREEDLKLSIEVLKLRSEILGDHHTDTINSMTGLAMTYCSQKRNDEAEKLQLKALQFQREIIGGKHPDTINGMASLAEIYCSQKRYDEAEELDKQVLRLRREISGNKHPKTIQSLAKLARTYYEQQKYDEAEELERQVLQLRREISGDRHPETIQSLADLARTYYEQRKYDEAEELDKQVLQLRREISGDRHPETIQSLADLARTYYEQQKYDEAEELERQVLQLRREISGNNHPETIQSLADLARIYYEQRKYDEAEELERQVLQLRREISGDRYPETIQSEWDLAMTYRKQGKINKAKGMMKKVMQLQQEVLGEKHPDTIKTLEYFASMYAQDVEEVKHEDLEHMIIAMANLSLN